MTLVLSQISHFFVLQVSDRLLTQGKEPFDPIANKNVLYVATNGIISLGYTGVAFLDALPTDQWIVEKLTGMAFDNRSRPGTRFGCLPKWHSIGLAERALVSGLNTTFAKSAMPPIARRLRFEIQIVGWQWGRRKRPRAFLAEILKTENASAVELTHYPRHIGRNFQFALSPEANAKFVDLTALRAALKGIRCADDAERALVRAIGEASAQSSLVGPNCMSTLLPPPYARMARIRYIGARAYARLVATSDPANERVLPAAFSPWVIGPGVIHAPSILSGTFDICTGGFKVTLEAPEPEGGISGAMGSILRPRDPSR